MNWAVILLGTFVGFMIAALKESSSPSPTSKATRPVSHSEKYSTMQYYEERRRELARRMREVSRLRQLSTLQQTMNDGERRLVGNWRRAIVGLVKLADQNLALARQQLGMKKCKLAVEHASTSVENIARALIHCFGGKPEPSSGQEEPLRMLSNRFEGDERARFEEACVIVNRVRRNEIALSYLSERGMQQQLFDEARTREIIEAASKVCVLLKQVMVKHFADEIPEFKEMCPKCCSLDTTLFGFNKEQAYFGCETCHHSWTEQRDGPVL